MSMTVLQLTDRLRTEADAYLYLEELRWNGRPLCPHCESVGEHYFLNPTNGKPRKTRTGAPSERRVWKCRDCRKQFSVLTGTIFHGTKIPVRTWCFLVFEMASSKNGISAREVERKYGLCPRSAWFAMHRIREAMKRGPGELLSGRVVSDETWYGGKPANRHGHDARKRPPGVSEKVPIVSLVSCETCEVGLQAIPDVSACTVLPT
jgi:transposase-like protein